MKNQLGHHKYKVVALFCSLMLLLTGCGQQNSENGNEENVQTGENVTGTVTNVNVNQQVLASGEAVVGRVLDSSELFTDRDKEIGYKEEECIIISLDNNASKSSDNSVIIDGNTITITREGSYLLSGALDNGSIVVSVEKTEKVQLILNGVSISCDTSAGIYIKQADKVFLTTAADSENLIQNTGEFVAIDDNNLDGAIFSKEDLVLNGAGTLKVTSEYGHGIVSKDDLKITSGDYVVEAGLHALSGKDSVRIAAGNMNLTSGEDGIHSGNQEEEEKGNVYILGGNIEINAKDDGIHGENEVVITNGTINITNSYEGIEGKIIELQGGEIALQSEDDGLNATDGSGASFDRGDFMKEDFIQQDGSIPGNRGNRPMKQGQSGVEGSEVAVPQGAAPESEIPEGGLPEGEMPEGVAPEGVKPEGIVPDRVMSEGVVPGEPVAAGTMSSSNEIYILISGGKVNIVANGDGIDSNGALYITGGETYVSGPENSGNGALDYTTNASITGGSIIAAGASGMAMNFDNSSTQASMLVNIGESLAGGSKIILQDKDGNVIAQYQALHSYNSVLISTPEVKIGETYTVIMGDTSTEVEMTTLLYGNGSGGFFGGMGGRK